MPWTLKLLATGISGVLLLAVGANPAAEEVLKVGDMVPEFECRDDHGQIWSSRDHLGKNVVIIYFYKSDFSFCCTRQAKQYQECLQDLECHSAEVVGISGDSIDAHKLFVSNLKLNHPLLSDDNGTVAQKFGVPLRGGGKATAFEEKTGTTKCFPRNVTLSRWTFIIDENRRVIYRESDVSPLEDTKEVLEFLAQRTVQPTKPIKPER